MRFPDVQPLDNGKTDNKRISKINISLKIELKMISENDSTGVGENIIFHSTIFH